MNVADGNIIGTFMPTHNHQDWTLPQADSPADAPGQRGALGPGQLLGPQDPRGAAVADPASSLSLALHADQFLVV